MKKFILISCLISYMLFISNVKSKEVVIPKEAIRLRIIANSDSEYDQKIKLQLSVEIEKKVQSLLNGITDVDKAKTIIKQNITNINNYISEYLKQNNYNKTFTIVYGNNYFPAKTYKGLTYKEGLYESLVITLGNGTGKNWWCVLFPPLCLMETESPSEYKFFVQELLEKYF